MLITIIQILAYLLKKCDFIELALYVCFTACSIYGNSSHV